MPPLFIRFWPQGLRQVQEVLRLCGQSAKGWRWPQVRRRVINLWRLLQHWPLHRELMDYFNRHPVLREIPRRWPRQVLKVYRPYPCQGFTVSERVLRLRQHHDLAESLLGPDLFARVMLQPRGVDLCVLPLPREQGLLKLRLVFAYHYDREGELSLVLDDPFGTPLYTLTFSLEQLPGGNGSFGLLVGALQGRLSLELTRHLTKLSLGLRPPALLVALMQSLARELGAGGIRAAGRSRHIYQGGARAAQLQFDYDGFWASVGGDPDGQGFFTLPLQAQRRQHADMPSNKRAQYTRRYAWLDELELRLAQELARERGRAPGEHSPSGAGRHR